MTGQVEAADINKNQGDELGTTVQYIDGFCIAFRCEIAIYNMTKYGTKGLNIIKMRFNCKTKSLFGGYV